MKIQLCGQSMRLRIDEHELERLLGGDELANITTFRAGHRSRQALRLADCRQPGFEGGSADWLLRLPEESVRRYSSRLPCREGLAFALPAGESAALAVTFEVDMRDSVRVRGPRAGAHKCSTGLPVDLDQGASGVGRPE